MINFIDKLKKINLPFLSSMDICIDLGTTNTRIGIRDKGIVLREPSVVGINSKEHTYIFFGEDAKKIIGKTPDFIKIRKPMVNSVISDFDSETQLINKFIQKSVHPYLSSYPVLKPTFSTLTITPRIASEIEQRAVEEVMAKVGATRSYTIEKPLATAMGCGIDIFTHEPHLVVDLGGGLIEISIISGGGIVANKTLKNAGDHMNSILANYIHLKYGIILGENTCENLKKELMNFGKEEKITTVRGKSLETGLPKSVKIKTSDIKEALNTNFNQIVDAIKELMEISPPEVIEELDTHGIILTGGLTAIAGIDQFFAEELKIEVVIASNSPDSTITGLLAIMNDKETLMKLVMKNI